MILENLDECKRLKQLLGLIQASQLPPMKGIDSFAIHNSCEWLFNFVVEFEKKNNSEFKQEVKEEIKQELPVEKVKNVRNKRSK